MKTRQLLNLCAAGLILLFTACDKLSEIEFDLSSGSVVLDVAPDTLVGAGQFGEKDIIVKLDSILEAKNVDRDKLKSAKIKKITMTIIEPSGANFDVIDYFDAELSAPGLAMKKVASLNPVPQGQNEVNLNSTNDELLDYIMADKFTYRLTGSKNQPIVDPMKIKIVITFTVVGDVLE